ncbi:MAG: glycosyl transferase [Flavobacteriaceae bacterium]|nr:MAG: glycosyl transferase [Flavobacteriaceae bacterium]
MKEILKYIYLRTLLGKLLSLVYHKVYFNFVPEKIVLKNRYQKKHGKKLNLKNPKSLNEKIVWLKLNDRTSLHTQCADKYAVREYVSEKIGTQYLVPLYYHTINPKEVRPDNLDKIPCIIKANHDSSGGIFVYDKSEIDWQQVQKEFKKRLKKNYYWKSKEWQYKNITPRIIVEKLLLDKNGNIPFDYKLHCLNGKVRMVQVDIDRGTDNHYRNWYSTEWVREPYKWSSPKGNGIYTDPSDKDVQKPHTLQEMIRLSEILAQPFDLVRVDWYNVDEKLFFGELTFHHDGGNQPILPETWDLKLGKELKLKNLA